MEVKNVLTNEQLEERMINLCKSNWKIEKMLDGLNVISPKDAIDNWFVATRPQLLKLLKIRENTDYKFVYHALTGEELIKK